MSNNYSEYLTKDRLIAWVPQGLGTCMGDENAYQ